MNDLARYIDHTCLKPDATSADIDRLCAEAREHRFYAVCVNGSHIVRAAARLEDTDIKIVGTVGFPLGAADSDVKRHEAEAAFEHGAHEVDVVLNIGRLKEADNRYVLRELRDIVEAAEERPVKVILETCLLTREEKVLACRLAVEAGAQFVKTSTGLSSGGATVEDVRLLREMVGPQFGVKAAGGIRDAQTARAMVEAGASRLGCSASVAIVTGAT